MPCWNLDEFRVETADEADQDFERLFGITRPASNAANTVGDVSTEADVVPPKPLDSSNAPPIDEVKDIERDHAANAQNFEMPSSSRGEYSRWSLNKVPEDPLVQQNECNPPRDPRAFPLEKAIHVQAALCLPPLVAVEPQGYADAPHGGIRKGVAAAGIALVAGLAFLFVGRTKNPARPEIYAAATVALTSAVVAAAQTPAAQPTIASHQEPPAAADHRVAAPRKHAPTGKQKAEERRPFVAPALPNVKESDPQLPPPPEIAAVPPADATIPSMVAPSTVITPPSAKPPHKSLPGKVGQFVVRAKDRVVQIVHPKKGKPQLLH